MCLTKEDIMRIKLTLSAAILAALLPRAPTQKSSIGGFLASRSSPARMLRKSTGKKSTTRSAASRRFRATFAVTAFRVAI